MVTQKVSEPVQDAVKAYLELAFGLTEASKKKAEKTVKKVTKELVGKGGATATQLQGLAEELLATGNANREAVSRMVRVELERALSRVGLATSDEVESLKDRIESLERQLRDAKAAAANAEPPVAAKKAAGPAAKATPAEPVIKAAGPAAKRPAPKVASDKDATEAIAAVHAAAKGAPAKKAVAKKAVAKKATKAAKAAA